MRRVREYIKGTYIKGMYKSSLVQECRKRGYEGTRKESTEHKSGQKRRVQEWTERGVKQSLRREKE